MKESKQKDSVPVMMAEEYWANSQLSIARHTGQVKCWGRVYVIVDKRGHDIFECSQEAKKEGREMAIEPGEPADLVDTRYVKIYRKVGRERFIAMVKKNMSLAEMRKEAGL